ncbi:MAG: GNAT family N-acetyltransferase [Pseudonocardiaceae bacterium]
MRSRDTRRRGVGDEALGQVSAWVRRHLASCIVLSVKSDNDHANRLYRWRSFAG